MANVIDIGKFLNSFNMPEGFNQHIPMDDVLDEIILIHHAEIYEHDSKGPGVALAISGPEIGQGYICTHAIGIVEVFKKDEVKSALSLGDVLQCRIIKRTSKNDKSRKVTVLVPA